MATASQRSFLNKLSKFCVLSFTSIRQYSNRKPIIFTAISTSAITAVIWSVWKMKNLEILAADGTSSSSSNSTLKDRIDKTSQDKTNKKHGRNSAIHSFREKQFRQFASLEYEGNIYMSPHDFLESVTEESPRPRVGRKKLTHDQASDFIRNTPSIEKGSSQFFRGILDKGIISYTEYIFLLCILTKPRSGFKIAFNMFDTDGNNVVDIKEFLVMESVINKMVARLTEIDSSGLQNIDSKGNTVKTSILAHFFGPDGNNVLNYKNFEKFMEDLQVEVLDLEFSEFAKGLSRITETDFAHILLRYTFLEEDDVDRCVSRLQERLKSKKGITFEQFKQFSAFINSLDDFAIIMKFYNLAGQAISQDEFQRAAKVCTGEILDPHIVNVIFQIFDDDGDGHLSYKEFISIMKDRLHRGIRTHLIQKPNYVDSFKHCLTSEIRKGR